MAIATDKLFDLIKRHTGIDKAAITSNSGNETIRQARMMASNLMIHCLRMENKEIAKVIDRTSPSVSYHSRMHITLMKYPEYSVPYDRVRLDLENLEDIEFIDREPEVKELLERITLIEARLKKAKI